MIPVGVMKKGKKDGNFDASNWLFAQTILVDIAPWNFACGSSPGSSYIFQISWKSVEQSRCCVGSKITLSHWLCPWLIQYNSLYYRTSCDDTKSNLLSQKRLGHYLKHNPGFIYALAIFLVISPV